VVARRSHGVLLAGAIALKSASESQFLTTCWLFGLEVAGAGLVLLKVSDSDLAFLLHDAVCGLLHLVWLTEHDFGLGNHALLFNSNLFSRFVNTML